MCGNEISPEKKILNKAFSEKKENYERIDELHCSERCVVPHYIPISNTHPHVYAVTNAASIYGLSFRIRISYSGASHHLMMYASLHCRNGIYK